MNTVKTVEPVASEFGRMHSDYAGMELQVPHNDGVVWSDDSDDGVPVAPVDTDTADIMRNWTPEPAHIPQAASATFSKDIDEAMGIVPEAAWPIIAELHSAHGYNAWYDFGVVCICVLGIGVCYLVSIGGLYHG